MYTLVWDKERYDIKQEQLAQARKNGRPDNRSGTFVRNSPGSIGYSDWKTFVERGRGRPGIDSMLLGSWQRCRDKGVDYNPRRCWDIKPAHKLEPMASQIRSLVRHVEDDVYSSIKDSNLLITIADPNGHIVRTCGDLSALRHADALNFGPGANWSEDSVGTNAIGTSLATGRPMQVFGEEHFCQNHHVWNCTAAPIFDPNGNIVACFDISGPTTADHSKALPLVLGAVRRLEKRLFRMHNAEMGHQSFSLLSTVFNSVLTGMLAVDCSGRITNANSAAATLLGVPQNRLEGREADMFFEFDAFLSRRKHESPRRDGYPISCRKSSDLICNANPVFSLNGTWFGSVISIMEPQHTPRAKAIPPPVPRTGRDADKVMPHILGDSPALSKAVQTAIRASRTPSTVLLTGESGTGKELFAQGIHQAGPRADNPFVALNCGALPEELVQSELFGYSSGAFTGADRKGRTGKFEQANGGTLFLDEISEMPLSMQVNLLRVLEERRVTPVGGTRTIDLNIKVIAATNRDLAEEVRAGRFREDLYYRLNVVRIHIPPLRERGRDVLALAEHHARKLAREFDIAFEEFTPDALDRLLAHTWPGNVRELFNALEYALNNMTGARLHADHLPSSLPGTASLSGDENDVQGTDEHAFSNSGTSGTSGTSQNTPFGAEAVSTASLCLKDVEAVTIRNALAHHHGNVSQAARTLGIGRNTLYAKIKQHGIQ